MKKNLLVTLADKNYIDQAKQLFSSVYFNAGWQGDYMLLSHEIPEEDLIWFRVKGILVKKCEPLYDEKLSSGYPVTVLDKFYLFTPEFKKWDNVVFLDADIIVRYPLDPLTAVKGFWASSDSKFLRPLKNQFNLKNKQNTATIQFKNKFGSEAQAFNTGVMAFSTDIISTDSFNKLHALFSIYYDICKYGEQPIINLYFYKKWKKFNFLYNINITYLINHFHVKLNKINGTVLHFCGEEKPWILNNYFYNEWKTNLEKANLIDLKNRKVKSIKNFNKSKIIWQLLYFYTIKIIFDIYYFIDRQIGLIGISLKKDYPSIYLKLQKIKNLHH